MGRRKPYTKVYKENQIRAEHVRGMGDVVFKGFQCLNPDCKEFIFVRKDEIKEDFNITCPKCENVLHSNGETKFFNYKLLDLRNRSIIEEGQFTIKHDDYVAEAQEYKYCIICNTIKPIQFFDRHKRRASGRQGECRLCKTIYNNIKNKTRITDQHREAQQKRRLYVDLSGGSKINSKEVYKRFDYRCFKCGKDLRNVEKKERHLDHTLPAYYLWPLTTETATLLCEEHNGEKAEKWPSEYYNSDELKDLSARTGISYEILSGKPHYNPDAIEKLKNPKTVDALLKKYSAYMEEIIKLHNRLLIDCGFDFFQYSNIISPRWIRKADEELQKTSPQATVTNTRPNTDEK